MEPETNNQWIPAKWLDGFNVWITKREDGYLSTEDGGQTWRESTEDEIKTCGF